MSDHIGQRLKQIRERRGISQRKLSRLTGVANATISLIEHNKLNPTVSMLKKVLDGIPISMSEFFSTELTDSDRFFVRANEFTEIADGKISYRQIGSNLQGKAIQLMRESYQPGAATGKHQMTHEGEECGLILSGKLSVTVDGVEAILNAGDAYYFDSTRPHSFANPGAEPCELISACTPPTF